MDDFFWWFNETSLKLRHELIDLCQKGTLKWISNDRRVIEKIHASAERAAIVNTMDERSGIERALCVGWDTETAWCRMGRCRILVLKRYWHFVSSTQMVQWSADFLMAKIRDRSTKGIKYTRLELELGASPTFMFGECNYQRAWQFTFTHFVLDLTVRWSSIGITEPRGETFSNYAASS